MGGEQFPMFAAGASEGDHDLGSPGFREWNKATRDPKTGRVVGGRPARERAPSATDLHDREFVEETIEPGLAEAEAKSDSAMVSFWLRQAEAMYKNVDTKDAVALDRLKLLLANHQMYPERQEKRGK